MTAGPVVALVMPSLVAYSALRLMWDRFGTPTGRGFSALLAPPLGLGFASVIYFALLHITTNPDAAARVDAGIWLLAVIWLLLDRNRRVKIFRFGPTRMGLPSNSWKPALAVAAGGFAALLLLAAVSFWSHWMLNPHGEWDGFAIWNLRARSIVRGAPEWNALFSPSIAWSHPYYPLLLPLSIARAWAYAGGRESTAVPALIAALFALCTVGTIVIGVGTLRGWAVGFLSGMALLTARTFVFQSSCQCADVPFGFFLLVAASCVAIGRQAPEAAPWLVTAGTAAGLAAWTKDEGQLLLILLAAATLTFQKRFRSLGFVAAGAAAPLAALAIFKLAYAPPGYLTASQTGASVAGRLLDGSRWSVVLRHVSTMLPAWGDVPGGAIACAAVAVAATAQPTRAAIARAVAAALIVALMFAGYVLVYVLTPLSIEWQIATSFGRLVTQLWPALVWAIFQVSGSPAGEPATSPETRHVLPGCSN